MHWDAYFQLNIYRLMRLKFQLVLLSQSKLKYFIQMDVNAWHSVIVCHCKIMHVRISITANCNTAEIQLGRQTIFKHFSCFEIWTMEIVIKGFAIEKLNVRQVIDWIFFNEFKHLGRREEKKSWTVKTMKWSFSISVH